MTINHPVEWWQLVGVLLVVYAFLRWYVPAAVGAAVALRAEKERTERRAQVEQARQQLTLARLGKHQVLEVPVTTDGGAADGQ
jgi:hypothetical protein